MSRTAVLKLAPAVLLAGLLLTASTQQAQAWWYVPAYPGRVYGYTVRPIFRRPLLRHWGYYHRPLLRWHYRRAYRPWPTVTHYSPACCMSYAPTCYSGCCGAYPPSVHYESYMAPDWESADPSEWKPAEPANSEPAWEEHEADLPSVRTPAPTPSPPADPPRKPDAAERSVYEAPVDDDPDEEAPLEEADDELPAVPPALDEPPTLDFPGDDAGLPFEPAPALPLIPDEARAPQVPPGATILAVEVPADARVFVNGLPTQTSGSFRQYVSRGLQAGQQYTYRMRAEVERDGQLRSETRAVTVQAGERAQVAFPLLAPNPVETLPAPETLLTLRVPERARVTLEGRPTQAIGNQRQFVTQALAEGQVWSDYRVVVEFEEEGVLQTREERLRLVGGRQHELAFDFDSPQIAAR